MTAAASVLALVRQHAEAAMIGLGLLAVVVACFLCVQLGKREQATADAVARYDRERDSSAAHATAFALKLDSVKRSFRDAAARTDSATTLANDRKLSAKAVRDRLTLHADSDAVLHTGTGDVSYKLPADVTSAFLAERASMDSAYAALAHKADALNSENVVLNREVQLGDSVRAELESNIRAANAEIDVLKRASHPRFTFAQGAVVGSLAVVAARIAVALLVRR